MKNENIFDWKGNEIKAGMIIYFVQTKSGLLESSRVGLMIPQTGEAIWENEKQWIERRDSNIWYLGQEYLVEEKEQRLFYTTMPDEAGYTFSAPISMQYLLGSNPTIAIKGVSDNKGI